MKHLGPDLFSGGVRMVASEAVDLTVQSLQAYGPQHRHWAVAWSGGKGLSDIIGGR